MQESSYSRNVILIRKSIREDTVETYFASLETYRVALVVLDPKVAGSKPGQGDGFLRAIKIRSTPSSRMGNKAERSHIVRFYGMKKNS
jgi:hypothetical protein